MRDAAWLDRNLAPCDVEGAAVDLHSDRPLEDDRVLVLASVRVHRRSERPRSEGVLEHRELPLARVGLQQDDRSERPFHEGLPILEATLVGVGHRFKENPA